MIKTKANRIYEIEHKHRLRAAKAPLQAGIFAPVIRALAALAIVIFFTAGIFMPLNVAVAAEQEDRIEISNARELKALADFINQGRIIGNSSSYVLIADIDLAELNDSGAEGWQPIGFKTSEESVAFTGVFDGAGYSVSGLWINQPDYINGAGLFGYNTGTIKNLNITLDEAKGGIVAKNSVGAIVGINDGNIINCTARGLITADDSGGISGNNSGTITDCFNYSDISGESGLGGITGGNSGTISFCQNAGNITATGSFTYFIGGIAGYASTGGKSINSCANYGTVSGKESIGGIIGYASGIEIYDCANYGAVFGEKIIGGIVGYSRVNITNCLNTSEISGEEKGGIAGKKPAGNITNSFYLMQNINEGDESSGNLAAANELIIRMFLERLNGGSETWALPAPNDFHYYPGLSAFSNSGFSKEYTKTNIAAYKGSPVLSGLTLTYGEALNKLTFNSDPNGVFAWQEPDKVLSAGGSITAYASFTPNGEDYGELYDIEIILSISKAQSVLSVSLNGWKAGQGENNPVIQLAAGEREENELIIQYKKRGADDSGYSANLPLKAGKYTVHVSYPESDNYLAGYALYDFSIAPDLTWLIIFSSILGGFMMAALAVYLTDKKFRYLAKIKGMLVREVIVEKPVIIEKPVFIQPEINTKLLSEYFEQLTPREMEVAKNILNGKTRKEIAKELFISEATAKRHIESILQKTDCDNQRIFVMKFKV